MGECVEVLNRIADGAQRPAPWRAAAEFLGDAFVRSVGAHALFAAPTTRDEIRAEWPLHGMANLLATLQADCPLKTAAAVHVNTMRTMARPRATAMSERVLWPFVRAFWMKVVREERFRLNAPRVVDANLGGLDESKSAEAMRRVLSAMVADQRASIPVRSDSGSRRAWSRNSVYAPFRLCWEKHARQITMRVNMADEKRNLVGVAAAVADTAGG